MHKKILIKNETKLNPNSLRQTISKIGAEEVLRRYGYFEYKMYDKVEKAIERYKMGSESTYTKYILEENGFIEKQKKYMFPMNNTPLTSSVVRHKLKAIEAASMLGITKQRFYQIVKRNNLRNIKAAETIENMIGGGGKYKRLDINVDYT